jgi:hypothetical protein
MLSFLSWGAPSLGGATTVRIVSRSVCVGEDLSILVNAQFKFVNRKVNVSEQLLSYEPRDENICVCFRTASHAAKLWRELPPWFDARSKWC